MDEINKIVDYLKDAHKYLIDADFLGYKIPSGLDELIFKSALQVGAALRILTNIQRVITPFTLCESLATREQVEELAMKHYTPGIKWRVYSNPMRNDNFFVAEDKRVEPCGRIKANGIPIYSAIPETKHFLDAGLQFDEANYLVDLLNMEDKQ